MNKKYLIVNVSPDYLSGKGKYVAGSKAPNDVTEILTKQGFTLIPIIRSLQHKKMGVLKSMLKIWFATKKIQNDTTVFIQYPMFNIKAFFWIAPLFKRFKSIVLIHDIRTYCFPHLLKYREKELAALNCFNTIIAHNTSMKERLVKDGIKKNIISLEAFDYLLADRMACQFVPNSIMFAGALQKSEFLKDLHKLNMQTMKFHLYGAYKPDIIYNTKILYKGVFLPDDISKIEAEWGLIWEGNSIESCCGYHGEYLKLIAPHKFSLYLACGLKIICWDQSAMANMVCEKGIGITVSRLDEIEEKIRNLTKEEKNNIEQNVKELMNNIRHGKMLENVIKEIESL